MVGAAALQREVLVELLENRLHALTVADVAAVVQVTRRSVSGVSSFNDR